MIDVQADYGGGPAIALDEKIGTREDVRHLDIAVDPVTGRAQRDRGARLNPRIRSP